MLLVRFLSLRNMEAETSYVTEAYWAVQQSRLSVVQDFVRDIEENKLDGPYGAAHQGWTGSKIRCYIGGYDPKGYSALGDYSLTQEHRAEMQDYLIHIRGESDDYMDDPCAQVAAMGEIQNKYSCWNTILKKMVLHLAFWEQQFLKMAMALH